MTVRTVRHGLVSRETPLALCARAGSWRWVGSGGGVRGRALAGSEGRDSSAVLLRFLEQYRVLYVSPVSFSYSSMSDPRDKQLGQLTFGIDFQKQAPIPESKLQSVLNSRGYELGELNGRMAAQTAEETWIYDPNEGFISIKLEDADTLSKICEQAENILSDEVGVDLGGLSFVSVNLEELVWATENTTDTFGQYYQSIDLGEHFEQAPIPCTVRFVSSPDIESSNNDFYDVRIESYIRNSDYYYVDLSYRKPGFDKISSFASDLQEKVDDLIDRVESGDSDNE